jgi:thymidylate synthase
MIPFLISGRNCAEVWLAGCNKLSTNNREYNNLILSIDTPCDYTNLSAWIENYNPKDHNGDSIEDVINTIFPYKLYSRSSDRFDLYKKYEKIYNKAKRIRNQKWGTYFQRLISFGKNFDTTHSNQLENAIQALQRGPNYRSAILFHLSAAHIDSNIRHRGGPCWHFGELTCNDDRSVNLVAVYRNHDYFNKCLGNLIGLSKLLEFICAESNRQPGKLIIHSVHACCERPNKVLKDLMGL